MRGRDVVAAVAGLVGAATAHALDVAGALPGVHESAAVRGGMGPLATVGWLMLAAALATAAARTRPVPVGAASALLLSGVPELVGRHDPGAVVEPGAIAGAVVQWLLLLALLALVVVVDRQLGRVTRPAPWRPLPRTGPSPFARALVAPGAPTGAASPRAPPARACCR